jgi:radical SAM/Cys-rich protein
MHGVRAAAPRAAAPRLLARCLSSAPLPLPRAPPARTAQRDARRAAARDAQLAACTSSLPAFADLLAMRGLPPLARAPAPTTVMVNIGKLCNLACRHCHVESSPARTAENMDARGVQRVLALLQASPSVRTLDVTGGAPELNPHFRALVAGARGLGLAVTTRCNLTVLGLRGQEGTAAFLAAQGVRVVASLPAVAAPAVERQRGEGVWQGSLAGLRALRAAGYGAGGHALDLVYNPPGARLPPPAAALEAEYRAALLDLGVSFGALLAITNMPIKRFADDLVASGEYEGYMGLLCASFNPATVPELMCRGTVSVAWDGTLWDCECVRLLGGGRWWVGSLLLRPAPR